MRALARWSSEALQSERRDRGKWTEKRSEHRSSSAASSQRWTTSRPRPRDPDRAV